MAVPGNPEPSWKANFVSGLVITLGNPKVVLFYLGLLATFVELDTPSAVDVVIIAALVFTVLGGAMLGYAFAADRAKRLLQNESAKRSINRAAGAMIMTTGNVLIVKS